MKVGFIGLGHIGAHMAVNLLEAGHEVIAYNRNKDKARHFAERGGQVADTVAEACQSEVLITMLADDAALKSVVLGSDGVSAKLGVGAIHVSMSTISVALAERLAAAHSAARQSFVAAPLGLKDIRLALAAAEDLRVPLPVRSVLRDRFLTLLAQRGERLDWSAIAMLSLKDATA